MEEWTNCFFKLHAEHSNFEIVGMSRFNKTLVFFYKALPDISSAQPHSTSDAHIHQIWKCKPSIFARAIRNIVVELQKRNKGTGIVRFWFNMIEFMYSSKTQYVISSINYANTQFWMFCLRQFIYQSFHLLDKYSALKTNENNDKGRRALKTGRGIKALQRQPWNWGRGS